MLRLCGRVGLLVGDRRVGMRRDNARLLLVGKRVRRSRVLLLRREGRRVVGERVPLLMLMLGWSGLLLLLLVEER